MLTEILDSNITTNLVRLGSRSSDERIAEYTLDKLEKVAAKSNLDRSIGRQYRAMKELEEEMTKVMKSIQLPVVSWDSVYSHLSIHYTDHGEAFENPPFWIQELFSRMRVDQEENGEWQEVKGKGKQREDSGLSKTLYGFWKDGRDIAFITPVIIPIQAPTKQGKNKGKHKSVVPQLVEGQAVLPPLVTGFFQELGFGSMIPPIPAGTRPLEMLRDNPAIWAMSLDERARLASEWEREIREMAYRSNLGRYNRVRDEYNEACKDYNDMKDEVSNLTILS